MKLHASSIIASSSVAKYDASYKLISPLISEQKIDLNLPESSIKCLNTSAGKFERLKSQGYEIANVER